MSRWTPQLITVDGKSLNAAEWEKISGTPADTIRKRINLYGYSARRAVFEIAVKSHRPKRGHPWQRIYKKEVVR